MQAHIETTLPVSGKAASVRRPTVRDMVEAERLAGEGYGPIALQTALLSRVATVEGRVLPFEDFQDLDADDLAALMALDFSGGGAAPPTSPSQSQS